ncbi:MAG: hypothetical protein R2781_08960 [Flavobacteriaceae bacterium]
MHRKIIILLLFVTFYNNAQVGINTVSPDASAMLDIQSTTHGILVPRVTSAQRDAIANPANGLMVFNTDTDELQYNSNTPAVPIWLAFLTSPTTSSSFGDSLKYSNTDTTTDINTVSPIQLPIFGTMEWNDNGSLYTVSGNEITIADTGRYEIVANVSLMSSASRVAPELRITINGVEVGAYASSGYIRDSNNHNESSLHLREVLEITSGDIIAINVVRSANSGSATMRSVGSSNFFILKLN